MNWLPTTTFQRHRRAYLTLMALAGAGGATLLFMHLMQTSAPFAEAVAKVSPELATMLSCNCPFCAPACQPPAEEMGLARFDKMLDLR